MRLFIAIDLPEEARQELKRAQEQLPNADLTLPREFHITLKFLGEVNEEKTEALRKALLLADFSPSTAELSGTGMFPNDRRPRVIWAGIKPVESLMQLHEAIDSLIGKDYPDNRKFKAHITLARIRHSEHDKLLQEAKRITIKPVKFRIDSFKLKRSFLSTKGPTYNDIQEYKAKGP